MYRISIAVALLACSCLHAQGTKSTPASDSGKIYVVDAGAASTAKARLSNSPKILQLDAARGTVLKVFPSGTDPDIAVSPDGRKLYVSSSDGVRGPMLAVYDTISGQLIQQYKNPGVSQHIVEIYASDMSISPSGRWLYMRKLHYDEATHDHYFYLTAFDTTSGQFLPNQATLPCSEGAVFAAQEDLQVILACASTDNIYTLNLASTPAATMKFSIGAEAQQSRGASGDKDYPRVSWGNILLMPGTDTVISVSNLDGSIYSTDTASGAASKVGQDASLVMETPHFSGAWRAASGTALASTTTASAFFAAVSNRHSPTTGVDSNGVRITRTDSSSFKIEKSQTDLAPFRSMLLSEDGKYIYTFTPISLSDSPWSATVFMLDASTLRLVHPLEGIASNPIFGVAAP